MQIQEPRLAGRIALVTGGASGIGAQAAKALASQGAKIVITDLNAEGAQRTAEGIVADGGSAVSKSHDVTSEADWRAAVDFAITTYGELHILVNNAGIASANAALMEQDYDSWRQILGVNLDGVFLGMSACGAALSAAQGASVINISSILGKVGFPGAGAYCASKGGVKMLTKTAAIEWAPLGIRVNSIHPGFIDTPMVQNGIAESEDPEGMQQLLLAAHPIGRLGVPTDIANAVVFLASEESAFMTGSELVIDGGYTAQ